MPNARYRGRLAADVVFLHGRPSKHHQDGELYKTQMFLMHMHKQYA